MADSHADVIKQHRVLTDAVKELYCVRVSATGGKFAKYVVRAKLYTA